MIKGWEINWLKKESENIERRNAKTKRFFLVNTYFQNIIRPDPDKLTMKFII